VTPVDLRDGIAHGNNIIYWRVCLYIMDRAEHKSIALSEYPATPQGLSYTTRFSVRQIFLRGWLGWWETHGSDKSILKSLDSRQAYMYRLLPHQRRMVRIANPINAANRPVERSPIFRERSRQTAATSSQSGRQAAGPVAINDDSPGLDQVVSSMSPAREDFSW
jgi:hypothetical protein